MGGIAMSWLTAAAHTLIRGGLKKKQLDLEINRHTERIVISLPHPELELLCRRHADARWSKYLDLRHYVRRNVILCKKLRLIGTPRQAILDIGCGGGIFMHCARYFGHDPVGIDIEDALLAEMAQLLGVDRRIERVVPLKPLSIGGSFDLIVCLYTKFDQTGRGRNRTYWSCDEWRFFISDIAGRLSPSGRIFLLINRGHRARYPGLDYYDAKVHSALLPGHVGSNEYLLDHKTAAIVIANLGRRAAERPPSV
jgi:SAM-dependent methyltransferase